MRKLFYLGVLMFLAPIVAYAGRLPWAEYGGDAQNTGQSSYVGPQSTESNRVTQLEGWNRDSFVSPVVDDSGTTYLFDDTTYWRIIDGQWVGGNGPARLKAISRTGAVKWTKELDLQCNRSSDGFSTIALGTNRLLYLACADYYSTKLFAIETASGSSAWELSLDPSYSSSMAVGNLTVDSNNTLYMGVTHQLPDTWERDHSIVAISKDGALLWSTNIGRGRRWDFTGPVLSPDKMTVYIYRYGYTKTSEGYNVYSGFISALATDTGAVKWDLPLEDGGTGWQTFTSFAVDANGTIWLASYRKPDPNICYGRAEFLMGISPEGYITHQLPMDGDIDCGSHVRVGQSGTIYVTYDDPRSNWYWDGSQWIQVQVYRYWDGSQYITERGYYDSQGNWNEIPYVRGGISAYDPVNGFKWRFELPDSMEANASPAIDAAENIYFAASHGEKLYSLNKDGQLNWEFQIDINATACLDGPDELPYGVAPVIGLYGSVYVMGSCNFYGIETPVSILVSNIESLVSNGTVAAQDGDSIIRLLDKIASASDPAVKEKFKLNTMHKINNLENKGKIDSVTAESLRTAVSQL